MKKRAPFQKLLAMTMAAVMTFSQSGVVTIAEEAPYASAAETEEVNNAETKSTNTAEVKSSEDNVNTAEVSQGAGTDTSASAGQTDNAAEVENQNDKSGSSDESSAQDAKAVSTDESGAQDEQSADDAETDAQNEDEDGSDDTAADTESSDDEKADDADDAEDAADSKDNEAVVTETPDDPEDGEPAVTEEEEGQEPSEEDEEEEDPSDETDAEKDEEDESDEAADEESEEKDDEEEGAEDPDEAVSYKVTFITDEHVSVFVDEEEIKEGLALAENGTLSFTTAAEEGYVVAKVVVNKAEELAPVDGVYTITGIEDDKTVVSITTEEVPEYYEGELTFNGADYTVKMNITEAARIPADASLAVREIPEGTSEYDKLFNEANRVLRNDADERAVTRARFFDIQILADVKAEDGTVERKEVEPKAPIGVEIRYHAPIEVADSNNVDMVHFAETGTEVIPAGTTATPTVDGTEEVKTVEFNADGFSVYGFMYTVDFTYDGYTYSIAGEDSVFLSELFAVLGIDRSAAEAASVEFTDYSLISIEQQEADWSIISLAPFSTVETLTVTMDDGSKYIIDVTDSQISTNLRDFVTSVDISANTNAQGHYVVVPGGKYDISMSFAENDNLQFPDGNTPGSATMTYSIPDGLNADGHQGTFKIIAKDESTGQSYPVEGNTFRINNNVLTVTFNTSDPNYSYLTASARATFNLTFKGEFDEDAEQVRFSDSIVKDIDVDTSNSVTVSKEGRFSSSSNAVRYTVRITSTGNSKNVVVKDTITDTEGALTLDPDSIQANSSTGNPVVMNGGVNGNHYEYTIPSMVNGETITITYSAKVDSSKIPKKDGKYITTGNNAVEVKSDGDPEPETKTVSTKIDYTPSIKKGNATVGADGKTLTWIITANEETKVSMAGGTITDTIRANSQSIMKYSGSGLTIRVYNSAGSIIRTDNVPWSALINKTDSSWTYQIPSTDKDKAYKYVITYTTEVDKSQLITDVTVNNDVITDGGKKGSGQGKIVPGEKVQITKRVVEIDTDENEKKITWEASFNVPKGGLNSAVVTDTYPNKGNYIESIIGEVSVDGLINGESYTATYYNTNVKIQFFKNLDKTEEGLQASSTDRTITVTLTTIINDDWVKRAESDSDYLKHRNNVRLRANGQDVSGYAEATLVNQSISKSVVSGGTVTVDGVELPYCRYVITISNVTTDVNTFNDVFDTELLEPYDPGGNTDWRAVSENNKVGQEKVSYSVTPDGIQITTSSASLPKDSSGNFYPKYKIYYCLKVKDANALDILNQRAAANFDGKYTFTNTANWGTSTDQAEVTYEYPGLDKEILTSDADLQKTDEEVYADFKITLNPSAKTMNGGSPLTLTDTVNNLSVDITSIKAEPSAGVRFDMSGNTVTYTIPDSTKIVITYKARVIFDKAPGRNETIRINFSNTAEMLGYKDGVNKTASMTNSGAGEAPFYGINLMKYEAGNMNKRLAGAVFALLDENKTPVKDISGNDVSFTTNSQGLIGVNGNQSTDGWSIIPDKRYYLRETKAPDEFMAATFDYSFMVSSDGSTAYGQYIYHSGDTMSAKNYRSGNSKASAENSWRRMVGYDS